MEDEIENAFLLVLNPSIHHLSNSSPAVTQAYNFCESLKTSLDAVQPCLNIILNPSKSFEVKFFALQIIDSLIRSDVLCGSIGSILYIGKDIIFNRVIKDLNNSFPFYFRSKLASLVCLLISKCYLSEWKSIFEDLIEISFLSPIHMDTFLRICIAFDEDIVSQVTKSATPNSTLHQLHTQIKDELRVKDVALLFKRWISILNQSDLSMDHLHMTLKTLSLYSDWIDISFFVSDDFIQIIQKIMTQSTQGRLAAGECIISVISKGMSSESKVQLINCFGLVQFIESIYPSTESLLQSIQEGDSFNIKFIVKLIGSIGLELCIAYEDSFDVSTLAMINKLIPYVVILFDKKKSQCSVDNLMELTCFIGHYVDLKKILKTKFPVNEVVSSLEMMKMNELCENLVDCICIHFSYSDNHHHHIADEDEKDEDRDEEDEHLYEEFRTSLIIIYSNLFFCIPSYCIKHLNDLVYSVTSRTSSISTSQQINSSYHKKESEVSIFLVFMYLEASKDQPQFINSDGSQTMLDRLITMILEFNLKSSNYKSLPRHVLILLFELIVRYSQYGYFDNHLDLLANSFSFFIDCIMQSIVLAKRQKSFYIPHLRRISYLFFRFTKSLKEIKKFSQVSQDAVNFLISFISVQSVASVKDVEFEVIKDILCNLYESLGILLAASLPINQKILQQITGQIFSNSSASSSECSVELFIYSFYCIGSMCKGIHDASATVSSCSSKDQDFLIWIKNILSYILNVLDESCRFSSSTSQCKTSTNSDSILKAAIFSFQRIIPLSDGEFLQFIPPLSIILIREMNEKNLDEFVDYLSFLSAIIHRFPSQIRSVMISSNLFSHLMEKIFYFFSTFKCQGTDDSILMSNLKKSFVSFCISIFSASITEIITQNESVLGNFINGVLLFLTDRSDLQVQRSAFNLTTKIISVWMPDNSCSGNSSSCISAPNTGSLCPIVGFDQFVYENMMPVLFSVLRDPQMNYKDGQDLLILGEICNLLKIIVKKQPEKSLHLIQNYLQSLGVSSMAIEEIVNRALPSYDAKKIRNVLQNIFSNISPSSQ